MRHAIWKKAAVYFAAVILLCGCASRHTGQAPESVPPAPSAPPLQERNSETPANSLPGVEGTYTLVHSLDDDQAFRLADASMIGETADAFFLYQHEGGYSGPDDTHCASRIRKLSKNDGKVLASLDVSMEVDTENTVYPAVRNTGDGFLLMGAKEVLRYSYDLTQEAAFQVPQAVLQYMRYELSSGEGMQHAVRFFSGYDMSADGKTWYFSCEKGLIRYTEPEGETILVSPLKGEGKLMEGATIAPAEPRLVDGETKLIYLVYGYEGLGGTYCLNLADGSTAEMPVAYHGGFQGTYYGPGHAAIMESTQGGWRIDYYRFADGVLLGTEIAPPVTVNRRDYVSGSQICPVGKRDVAYSLDLHRNVQSDNTIESFFYRAPLDTMEPELIDFTNKNQDFLPQIIGVLEDGRLVFTYRFFDRDDCGIILAG